MNAFFFTQNVLSQYMFPIGTIIPYAGDLSKIPYGWHVCDGTNGTPDLSGRFLEGTTTKPKESKDAGLPNIIGDINGDQGDNNNTEPFSLADTYRVSGALSPYDIRKDHIFISKTSFEGDEYSFSTYGLRFDASKSNPIYGSSETVQPASYTVYYIMRIK